MAKRRSASSGWQTPGTRVFFIQVQWFLAPSLERDAVLARIRQVTTEVQASARVVFEQTALAADADDNEDPTQPFTDLMIETADAAELWAALQSLLSDPGIGSGLRQAAIIGCDASARTPGAFPAEPLRLHHFDPSEPLDGFQ